MNSTLAISKFKEKFSMYANATLEAQQNGQGWKIFLQGVDSPIGHVTLDGVAHLY